MNFLDLFLPKRTKVTINGNIYHGKDFIVNDETIVIDGQTISTSRIPSIEIQVFGDVGLMDLKAGKVTIQGNASEVKTMSGNVESGDIGTVKTMSGNVKAKIIKGDVKTMSGSVSA